MSLENAMYARAEIPRSKIALPVSSMAKTSTHDHRQTPATYPRDASPTRPAQKGRTAPARTAGEKESRRDERHANHGRPRLKIKQVGYGGEIVTVKLCVR